MKRWQRSIESQFGVLLKHITVKAELVLFLAHRLKHQEATWSAGPTKLIEDRIARTYKRLFETVRGLASVDFIVIHIWPELKTLFEEIKTIEKDENEKEAKEDDQKGGK